MSDVQSATSKAAKKNKKRHSKKTTADSNSASQTLDHREMLAMLKEQLNEAKANKDHVLAGTLRDQIWVLTDLLAGVRTAVPEHELNAILEAIEVRFRAIANTAEILPSNGVDTSPPAPHAATVTNAIEDDKRMKNLRKKLEQIEKLKARQQAGDKLEANQVEKIKSEDKLKEEIAELEGILNNALAIK